jgi:hypothetical protein
MKESNLNPNYSLECKYEIFKKLSLEKLNYKIILPGDHIVTPATVGEYNQIQATLKKQQQDAATQQEE